MKEKLRTITITILKTIIQLNKHRIIQSRTSKHFSKLTVFNRDLKTYSDLASATDASNEFQIFNGLQQKLFDLAKTLLFSYFLLIIVIRAL